MITLTKEQELAYKQAFKRSYAAAAFDIDGTLTPFGRLKISRSLRETLAQIPTDIPLALCTGRPIEFVRAKLDHICEVVEDAEAQRRRWFVICENGAAAYRYNLETEEYEPFFESTWPQKDSKKEVLSAMIKNKLSWEGSILVRKHTLIIICHRYLYPFPRLIKLASARIARKTQKVLIQNKLDHLFEVNDSGLGVIVVPKDGGKGLAVEAWAEQLKIPVKSVLCVGDRPDPGGNDEQFLSGEYGTPFTVGLWPRKEYPLPVLDEQKRRLKGPKGTEFLLKQIFLNK